MAAAAASHECPIVLVCGFLGPANDHWCERYWGEALGLATAASPVIPAPVSCVGSCWDRACELFYYLYGGRVDYGEAHARECGHERYGRDFTGRGRYEAWSAARPVHLIGHSFGGNTIRALRYLVCTDHFGVGSDASWIRSTVTLSSPLRGSALTYVLGAAHDHDPDRPVRRFSAGYLLGISVHFYELFARRLGVDRLLDFGMGHWGLEQDGLLGWASALVTGGANGGGTKAVCAMDNAAHDMTFAAAQAWAERVHGVMDNDPHLYEINIVARNNALTSGGISWAGVRARMQGSAAPAPAAPATGFGYRTALVARDVLVWWSARCVQRMPTAVLRKSVETYDDVEAHVNDDSDGVCSARTQYRHSTPAHVLDLKARAASGAALAHGQYTCFLDPHHDHFSVVPLPESAAVQRGFFEDLFAVLRNLRAPQPAGAATAA